MTQRRDAVVARWAKRTKLRPAAIASALPNGVRETLRQPGDDPAQAAVARIKAATVAGPERPASALLWMHRSLAKRPNRGASVLTRAHELAHLLDVRRSGFVHDKGPVRQAIMEHVRQNPHAYTQAHPGVRHAEAFSEVAAAVADQRPQMRAMLARSGGRFDHVIRAVRLAGLRGRWLRK